jgi:hypothetical protein
MQTYKMGYYIAKITFGILLAQFSIAREPARFWDQEVIWYTMNTYVIMHTMIIENERESF